jgi:hypothetical protein
LRERERRESIEREKKALKEKEGLCGRPLYIFPFYANANIGSLLVLHHSMIFTVL